MKNQICQIKQKLNTGRIDTGKLIKLIDLYDVISFDIFDTLLKRDVMDPRDVFRLMAATNPALGKNFVQRRVLAESAARDAKQGQEVTLSEIYQRMEDFTDEQRDVFMQLELHTEEQVLGRNLPMMQVYQACLRKGKTILITSDMYLPASFIENALKKNGFFGYHQLYLSSDRMCTKQDGSIFLLILKEQKCQPSRILHIGDSRHSDYKMPRKLGLGAYWIPKNPVNTKRLDLTHSDKLSLSVLNATVNNRVPHFQDWYEAFGYDSFGLLLYGFAIWLYHELKEKNIQKVYFFSRDGYIMKQAFDLLYQDTTLQTYYLEVSRRSLRVPVLWMDSSFNTILSMISPSKFISLRTLFDGVGLDIENYQPLIAEYGFDMSTSFDRKTIRNQKKLKELYCQLIPEIERVSKGEYEMLRRYLDQNKIGGKFAIVDIGWSGGMQRYLSQTLDKLQIHHEIYGYYIGIADYYKRNTEVVPDLNLNGYLFDFMHHENETDKRNSFVGLFESLFLEQGGSVKQYQPTEDGTVCAVRYPYEYLVNGKPTRELKRIQKLQAGALQFVRDVSALPYLRCFRYTADELFYGIHKTGCTPSMEDVNHFGDFRFMDEGETTFLAAPKGMEHYLKHPALLKHDFLGSRWKIGFMKRLFKAKAPYEKIYRVLLKLK